MPSDAAFREALDAYKQAVYDAGFEGGFTPGGIRAMNDARARVLALYAEIVAERDDLMAIAIGDKVRKPSNPSLAERQGEEAVVTDGTPDGQYIELRFVQSTRITDGDRVWVTKVEEGQ